ncbi:hypothetical protein [Streptomyces sp. NPDC004579]|uniref:hypothetical protein n=1 Tax=Streptomyces sp. NPDC004579 TaxID=3154667 RepID=UPI0033A896AA
MNLESLIIDPWPAKIREATDQFYQGHLIENVPLFYGASPHAPATTYTEEVVEPPSGKDRTELCLAGLPHGHQFEFCILTSATCDIHEAGTPKNPFIQVSPVIDLSSDVTESQAGQIRAGRFADFVYLTSQPRDGGLWVVDLRVSLPLEKGTLVGRKPIDGFATHQDRFAFARRLSRRVGRTALAESVHDDVVASLNTWIKSDEKSALRSGSGRFTDVERVALNFKGDDPLSPQSVQVYVFEETPLSLLDRGAWRGWRNSARKNLRKKSGIELLPVAFTSLKKMTVAEYETLIPVALSNLGRIAAW